MAKEVASKGLGCTGEEVVIAERLTTIVFEDVVKLVWLEIWLPEVVDAPAVDDV